MFTKHLTSDDVRTRYMRETSPWNHDYIFNYPPPIWLPEMFGGIIIGRIAAPVGGLQGYIQIPFCADSCGFCHYTRTSDHNRELLKKYTQAVLAEAMMWSRTLNPGGKVIPIPLETMYVGGGTPSLLGFDLRSLLLPLTEKIFRPASNQTYDEFTVEANPIDLIGTIGKSKIEEILSCGADRISIGVQSFDDILLNLCNRTHSSEQAKIAVENCREAGIKIINMDLIYGLPTQTMRQWESTLEQTLALSPESITIHQLRIKQGTPFWDLRHQVPYPDKTLQMHLMAWNMFVGSGYTPIEEGAFVKPGFDQIHQKRKWRDHCNLLGIGLASYSYIQGISLFNHRNLNKYFEDVSKGVLPIDRGKILTPEELKARRFVMGLFFFEGVSRAEYLRIFGEEPEVQYGKLLFDLKQHDLIAETDGRIHLTPRGGFHGHRIRQLFYLPREKEVLKGVLGGGAYFDDFKIS